MGADPVPPNREIARTWSETFVFACWTVGLAAIVHSHR